MQVFTAAERPELDRQADELSVGVWPEYNLHGDVLSPYWRELDERFPELQFVLVEGDEILAQGHMIPCRWDGSLEGLPAGIDDVLLHGLRLEEPPNAASALAIEVLPQHQSSGLAPRMLQEIRALCAARGLDDLLAPLRPSWKERYPLTPIERYTAWTREDGLPFDPWLRVHVRAGGEILKPIERSMRITGTVAEWEEWTGMAFPENGSYVFPQGLAPLEVDRDADLGAYWEPNVWVRHRV
jgi:GNAT superfamily N-acetyltransferase